MRIAWLLLVLILAAGGGAYWVGQDYLRTPVGGSVETTITIKRGTTLRPVLHELHDKGVLSHPDWLYAYARARRTAQVMLGTYEIQSSQNPVQILSMLLEGRVQLESFTMAEGLNRWQVRALLHAAGWMTPAQFDALCDDAKFLADSHLPGPTCEGYLFPETYKFARGVPPSAILQTMFAAYHRVIADVMQDPQMAVPLNEGQFATLSSIVEKETGASQERPHIACVFYNRLKAKPPWRLETDPTVIYAATLTDPNFDGNLTRNHLRLEHPYNTYHIYGLPPGPIANPGRAAFQAVAHPADCKDFFFVSSNNGQHIFCPDLTCHNAAVTKWQVEYFRGKHRSHPKAPPPAAAAPAP